MRSYCGFTSNILENIKSVFGQISGDFKGLKLVVSAGGTREKLDPVRHLTNRSSGKMGYALAETARDRGAEVVLVSASKIEVNAVSNSGKITKFQVLVRIDTEIENQYYRHGGLLPYVLRQMML